MFDVHLLSSRALQETSKLLTKACSQPASNTLLDNYIQSSYPPVIGDAIMLTLDNKNLLSDSTMQLFDIKRLRLAAANITPGSGSSQNNGLTFSGVSVLKTQYLKKLRFSGQRKFDSSGGTQLLEDTGSVLRVLNDWTIHNLVCLELPYNELSNNIVLRITSFKNLRLLNVASTMSTFNSISLEICVNSMLFLEDIDISETHVTTIEPLRLRKETLRCLSLYATQALFSSSTPNVLFSLTRLKYLDISLPADVPFPEDSNQFKLAPFLCTLPSHCPDIEYLDISGNQRLSLDSGRPALLSCVSSLRKLKFIGAAIDGDVSHWLKALETCSKMKITGTSSLQAILQSLELYKFRPSYLHHALVALYNLIGDFEENELFSNYHLICLKSVIAVCQLWSHDRLVQLSGTASIYALTRGTLSAKVPKSMQCDVVSIASSVLEIFSQLQLVKNAVLLLCNDIVLDCGADWLNCASALLFRLRQIGVSNTFVAKMSVLIISVLASRLSATEAASLMSSTDNWLTLLTPVKLACHDSLVQMAESTVLRYCLSALWNLTDENSSNCKRFVEAGGLQTYGKLLKVYRENAEQERQEVDDFQEQEFVIDYECKLLGLLNNVSEVPVLRSLILEVPEFLDELIWRLHQFSHTERHYFAGGILANILNEGDTMPCYQTGDKSYETICETLSKCVAMWQIPTHEHVAYRSFRPFAPLLKNCACTAVRHWALWALGLVATKNPDRYATMLKRDEIFGIVRDIMKSLENDELALKLATRLVAVLLRVDEDGSLATILEEMNVKVET